jgi:hypothetical protein
MAVASAIVLDMSESMGCKIEIEAARSNDPGQLHFACLSRATKRGS